MLQKTRYLRLFLPFMLLCILFFRLLTVPPSAEQQLAACFGRQLVVQGAVEPLSVRRLDGFSSAVLRCEKVYSDTELAYSGRLRVSMKSELPQVGCVVLKGTLEQLDSLRNPGGFDAASYNRVQELGGRLRKAQLLKTEPQVLWWQRFSLWNKKLSERIEAAAGAEYGALLSGMVLGGSGRLDEETRELFTDNGLAHLLSVSGTHIVLLTGLLLALLQWVPLPWRKVIVIILLAAYALLCGLRPPVLRALAMSSVLLLGGSGAERGRLLCLVASLLLCLQPLWLADVGFQLSFGAAAGLLWLLPACQRLLPQALPAPIGEAAAVSLAAQLAVLPLEVYYFHQISLIALVSNIVLVPVFGLFLGRKGSVQLWVSMVIAVAGLYMLCMKNGFGGIETSDWILLSCAVLFSFQIMAVDHFSPQMDGVRLSLVEFFVVSVESTVAALLFEQPAMAEFVTYAGPILYCGVMSSGVAYTLQILGQRDLNPAVASLIMCLESVFSALGGWLLLGQNLSMRESAGCTLIFAAVVLSQLPLAELRRCKKGA